MCSRIMNTINTKLQHAGTPYSLKNMKKFISLEKYHLQICLYKENRMNQIRSTAATSQQEILLLVLFSTNMKLKIYRNVILSVV